MRHLLTLWDLSADELRRLLRLAREMKQAFLQGQRQPICSGHVLGLLFEKPSLRTRVSFEAAFAHLGGHTLFLGSDAGWGQRESVADFGRVVSGYVDALVFRGNNHAVLEELARNCSCPVINGLTPDSHPCQAIADMLTIQEICGTDPAPKVAYVGDGNNVARSLAEACAMLGVSAHFASPPGFELPDDFVARLRERCPRHLPQRTSDPREAVDGAAAVYTDVWISMGQESQREARLRVFADYQVNRQLLAGALPNATFLHCLPAHRGEEVTDDVMDGPQSAVFLQAANRMHAQKAILTWLITGNLP